MNAIVTTPLRKYQHPALQGLTEKALTAVYNASVSRVLAPQEWLFRAGEAAGADILILEGSAGVHRQNSTSSFALQLFAGDCVPAVLLQQNGYYTHDCLATQPLKVLLLDTAACNQLDDNTQLLLHKNLLPAVGRLVSQLHRPTQVLAQAPTVDATAVSAVIAARQEPYLQANSLQAMLANLPRLPPYTTKLTSLMSDPKASTRNIVDIAKQDPSLTASVLKSVNSAYFGLKHKIKDFQHAVMMLGFTQMQQLLINTGVQSTMPDAPEFRQLQAHSMMVSVLCSEISLTLKIGSAPMLSTLGILHDIGKSIVLLLRRQNPKQDFLLSLLDPDMVGTILLREWQIPENISEVLQFQSYADLLPPDCVPAVHRENVAILYLAHRCLERLRNLNADAPVECPARPWLAKLGCRELTLDDFLFGRLVQSINSRAAPLPLVMQDLLKKAQSFEARAPKTDDQPNEMVTPP